MKQQHTKKVFIADDDPYWTQLLSQILTDLGYTQIVCFENGAECIRHLHLNPHLVFLDYQMEDMNGLEVLKQIKDYYPGIGVVFCTAHEDLGVAVDAMKYGSFDYLLKQNASRKEVAAMLNQPAALQFVTEKIY